MLIPGHGLTSAEKRRVTEKVTDMAVPSMCPRALTPLVHIVLLDFFSSGEARCRK